MKQLDPKAVWLFFLNSVWRWLMSIFFFLFWLAIFLFEIIDDTPADESEPVASYAIWVWLGLLALIIIVSYVWARLTYRFYRYELSENGFKKEEGVIYKKYTTIPYDRIQNVDIYRGILARLLGLSDLKIQTAGTSATISRYGGSGLSAEGRIPGLSKEVAEEVRDELIARARGSKNSGV